MVEVLLMNDNNNNESPKDEVFDKIPENVKKIDEATNTSSYTYTSISSTGETPLSAILSLMLGIFSIICCWTIIPPAISAFVGLFLGILALSKKGTNKTCAIIGVILCIIGIALFIIFVASIILAGSIGAIFSSPISMQWGVM